MKKIYIILLTLLAALPSFAYDYYIKGNLNNSNNTWNYFQMSDRGDDSYWVDINITNNSGEFGICYGSETVQNKWYASSSSNTNLTSSSISNLPTKENGTNWKWNNLGTGLYNFIFYPKQNKLIISKVEYVYYLHSQHTGTWNDYKMTQSGNKYSYDITCTGNFNFLIKRDYGTSTTWYSSADTSNSSVSVLNKNGMSSSTAGKDWWFDIGAGSYTLTFDTSNNKVIVTPKTLYLTYSSGSNWNNYSNNLSASISNNKFTWEREFKNGDYFTLSTGRGNENNVNNGRYSANANGSYWITNDNINTTATLNGTGEVPFYINSGDGKYLITADFSDITNPKISFEKVNTVTAPANIYLIYQNASGDWDLSGNNSAFTKDATGMVFTLTDFYLDEGKLFKVTENVGSDWNNINNGAYGEKEDGKGNVDINFSSDYSNGVAKGNSCSYKAVEDGYYTIKLDFTTTPPTLTITGYKAVSDPNLTLDYTLTYYDKEGNVVDNDGMYAVVSLTATNKTNSEIPSIYYIFSTSDTDEPSTKDMAYSKEFMVVNDCVIKAYAFAGAKKSNMATINVTVHDDSKEYTWDDVTETAEQLEEFIIDHENGVTKTPSPTTGVTKIITVNVTVPEGVEGEHSWAKFESLSYYNNHPEHKVLTDHLTGASGQNTANCVENNNTNSHVCRNFQKAYYRYYFTSTSLSPTAMRARAKLGVHDSDDVIAYTTPVDDNTTGIEDISTDVNNIDDENAPVYYYNLQGVRVINPSNGIYIRVQGNTRTKEYIR